MSIKSYLIGGLVFFLCFLSAEANFPFTGSLSLGGEYEKVNDKELISSVYVDNENLMLYKEEDKKYVSYGEVKLEVAEEELDVISNAFAFNDKYYICSTKALFEVGISEIKKLSAHEVMQGSYKLKCFVISDVTLVGLADYYKDKARIVIVAYTQKDESLYPNEKEVFNSEEGVAKDYITRDFGEEKAILILYSSNNEWSFWLMQFVESELTVNGNNREAFGKEKTYSVGKMANYKEKTLIFSYEPEENKYFSIQICYKSTASRSDAEPKTCDNQFDFFPMLLANGEEFSINSIQFFNEETKYAYFKVTSQSKKIYIGVIDVLQNVIISNEVKEDAINVFGLADSSNNFLLGYNSETAYHIKCPFFKGSDDTCAECTEKTKIDLEKGNECLSEASKYVLDNYSFDGCPFGYHGDENNSCKYCSPDKYITSSGCETECTEKKEGRLCYKCVEFGKLIYYGYDFMTESGKSITNGTCVTTQECPENAIQENDQCKVCSSYDKVKYTYENGTSACVEACLDGLGNENGICVKCADKSKYIINGKCTETCPEYAENDKDNFFCKICKDSAETPYLSTSGKCEEKCEDNEYYDNNNVCKECKEKIYNNNCIASCPEGTGTIGDGNKCVICKQNEGENKFLDKKNSKCVSECPEGSVLNSMTYECEYCSSNSTYYYEKKCLESCPKYTLSSSENICKSCGSKSYFREACLESCPEHTIKTEEPLPHCKECEGDNLFYYNGECFEKCGEIQVSSTDSNSLKFCYDCGSSEPFYYNNKCYSEEDCPVFTVANKEKKVCEDKCQFECLNGAECNPEEDKCECPKGFSGLYCEIENMTNEGTSDSRIKIYSTTGKILRNKVNLIAYETSISFTEGYDITWKVTDAETNQEINSEYYFNGIKDDKIKLSEKAFENIKKARIAITLVDYATNQEIYSFIEISFNSLDPGDFELNVVYPENTSVIAPMKEYVKIFVTISESKSRLRRLSKGYQKLSYEFSFVDFDGEEIPIRVDETEKYKSVYEGMVPLTDTIVVTISDAKGQSVKIKKSISMHKDDSYSKTLKDICSENTLDIYVKLLEVYNNIIHNISKDFTNEDIELIKGLLKHKDNSAYDRVVLAMLNYLMKNGKVENFSFIENLLSEMIEGLSTIAFEDEEKLQAFYRNLDANLKKAIANADAADLNMTEYVESTKKNIKKLNELFIDTLVKGEKVQLETSTFKTYLEKPGRVQTSLAIGDEDEEEAKTYDKYSDYAIARKHQKSSTKEDECEGSTFCVGKDSYKSFKNDLSLRTNSDDMVISVVKLNNTNIYKDKGYKPMTSSSVVSSVYSNNNEENQLPLAYSLSLKVSPDYDLSKINAGSVCVPISDLKNPRISCKTYFNYKTNKTICKCKNTGEIAGLFDETLANFYKLLQFPKLSVDMINPLSGAFICCSLMLMIIFSIVLLIYDYIDDKSEITYMKMSEAQKVKRELDNIKGLKDTKIFGLAWFVTQNVFPFFEMVSIYNYKQPRYIRFVIQMISMLVSLLFSVIPYYKTNFTYKEVFIDQRDIEKESWNVNNLPTKLIDVISGLIYSICASVSIIIIVSLFSFLLKFKTLLFETWKYRKTIILSYIKKNLITEKVTQMERVKTRIGAVFAFIGIYNEIILKKQKKKNSMNNSSNSTCVISSSTNSRSESDTYLQVARSDSAFSNNSYRKSSFEKHSSLSFHEKFKNVLFIERSDEVEINVESSKSAEKEEKLRQTIKDIRRRYSKSEDFLGIKINFQRKKIPKGLGYNAKMLKVSRNLYNFSFFNIEDNTKKKEENCTEKIDILKTVIASIIMGLILSLIYYYLIIMFADIYERYHFYIVKVWLLPSLINLTLIRLVISYIQNLAYILAVMLFYETRYKTKISEILFKYIIPKYLIYTYKVQMMLNKYHEVLEKDLELKCSCKEIC